MVDILHRVGVQASVDDVYKTLGTVDGLAGWWTTDATGDPGVDGHLEFRFPNAPAPGGFDITVLEAEPGKVVRWEVTDGPEEWIGTHIRFDLDQEDDYAIVKFQHEGWKKPVDFMYHCSTKWATFLLSLKSLVETGTGRPAPNDVRTDNW